MRSGAVVDQTTYRRILQILKSSGGGLSVRELCDRMDLSSMAVRRQLAILEGRSLVFSEKAKKPTGRPEFRYFLTRLGHEEFPRDYAGIAIELLVQLRSDDGRKKINDLFEARKNCQVERFRTRVTGKSLEVRVHEVTRLLSENGYMAAWEKLGEDRFLISEMNCPVEQVARKFPQTCICEEEFLSELLEARVTRRQHILQKDHFCAYLVEGDGQGVCPRPVSENE